MTPIKTQTTYVEPTFLWGTIPDHSPAAPKVQPTEEKGADQELVETENSISLAVMDPFEEDDADLQFPFEEAELNKPSPKQSTSPLTEE